MGENDEFPKANGGHNARKLRFSVTVDFEKPNIIKFQLSTMHIVHKSDLALRDYNEKTDVAQSSVFTSTASGIVWILNKNSQLPNGLAVFNALRVSSVLALSCDPWCSSKTSLNLKTDTSVFHLVLQRGT